MLNLDPLPIDDYRKEIESSIRTSPVTIIDAETGAGKSTRVPLWQFLQKKKVLVTQPRRIATRSLSYYLAGACNLKWGKEIGYQTGFERKFTRDTTLLYLTDGVAVIKEIKSSTNYDVLVVDEVHEWNLNQEVLIGLIRERIKTRFYQKTGKRVVIMSATMQAKKLSAFLHHAPVITVPGRSHPVAMFEHGSYFMLADTVHLVSSNLNTLVFLPGKKEIEDFIGILGTTLKEDKVTAEILPLHSELSVIEQSRVFRHYKVPKVVVATDIAQTSLTIDDIDAVVDSGIKKEIYFQRGVEGLYPVDISQAECKQRAGRAGRVKSGQYILCSDLDQKDRIKFPEPEIRRLNPESVILKFLKWGISPQDFSFFHPPHRGSINKAIKRLQVFGAITENQQITPDGAKMADLPVSIRSARMILEAQKGSRQVFDDSLKIISILEVKGIVQKGYRGEKLYEGEHYSDLLNQLTIWKHTRIYKKLVNWKKLSAAREIYRELKNRIKIFRAIPEQSAGDGNILFRSILSLFVDFTFSRVMNRYFDQDIERKLDRDSVITEKMPEMITGMPFDLLVKKKDPNTGEEEERLIPLVTFVSEMSFEILEKLKPFSYTKQTVVAIENSEVLLKETIWFGGKVLKVLKREPHWTDRGEIERISHKVFEWYLANDQTFNLRKKLDFLKKYFGSAKQLLRRGNVLEKIKSFHFYVEKYIKGNIRRCLKTTDLNFFFQFSPCFQSPWLKDLLPSRLSRKLAALKWPEEMTLQGKVFKLQYFDKKPFVHLTMDIFEKIQQSDLILPTGAVSGVNLGGRRYHTWQEAVDCFHRYKRKEIFKTLKSLKKNVEILDLKQVEFPLRIQKGVRKDKVPFEFFAVPAIDGEAVFLVHFDNEAEAVSHYRRIKDKIEELVQKHERERIKNIFLDKGWKVSQ